MINDFVAFDFETASGKNPCSIGLVHYKNGIVVNEYYSLINPEIKFNPYTVRVHGINEWDVKNEKKFHELWDEIEPFFSIPFVIAHNSVFDEAVLKYMLNKNNFDLPSYECLCTLKLARKLIRAENYKLNTLARVLKIDQKNYHNALDDAKVCALLFVKLLELENDFEKIRNICKTSSRTRISKTASLNKNKRIQSKIDEKILKLCSQKLANYKFVISGIFSKFSREEMRAIMVNNGGKVSGSISSKTNFVVAGENMGPSKLAKAESLGIKIIGEEEFLKMLQ